ncbi:MAG: hypothetical protein M3O80_01550, partial [Chloroflexota bacterium]|nr:hypothetical protein [Chloroflexota bacterium]
MRALVVACGIVGPVLVGLSLLTDAFRPFMLEAGVGVLLLGLVLSTVRTLRRSRRPETRARIGDARPVAPANVAVREPAPPVAPPHAEVLLLVGGNGASEPSMRWYHVAAATSSHVAATKALVNVGVRGEHAGAGQWQWQTGDRAIDLTQTGARIPIVIGRVGESAEPIGPGWVVPFKNWYLTPLALSALGPFLAPFIAGVRHVFDVSVNWDERGIAQTSSASFELRF